MITTVLTAQLRSDQAAVEQYETLHSNVWAAVRDDNARAGVRELWIYRTGYQLIMVVSAEDSFCLERWGSFLTSDKTREWLALTDPLMVDDPSAILGSSWKRLEEICHICTA